MPNVSYFFYQHQQTSLARREKKLCTFPVFAKIRTTLDRPVGEALSTSLVSTRPGGQTTSTSFVYHWINRRTAPHLFSCHSMWSRRSTDTFPPHASPISCTNHTRHPIVPRTTRHLSRLPRSHHAQIKHSPPHGRQMFRPRTTQHLRMVSASAPGSPQ
jgi:hypothetical protein